MYKSLAIIVLLLIVSGCTVQSPAPIDNLNINTSSTPNDSMEKMADSGNLDESIWSKGSFSTGSFEVVYFENTKGFLARPQGDGRYPGIVMIHEWWGLNDNIKDSAKRLASHGYIVLAVDLYEGRVARDSNEARQFVSSVNQERSLQNLQSAVAYLREEQNSSQIASFGWCFGGGQSLQLALSGEQLDATIMYYGSVETDKEKLSLIQWPVLGVFGSDDASIPVANVNQFEAALNETTPNEIHIYQGVGHAFANPSNQRFSPKQTKDAWEITLGFLEKTLKNA